MDLYTHMFFLGGLAQDVGGGGGGAGVWGAVQQRGAHAPVRPDLCPSAPVPQEVLRPQRYLQISGSGSLRLLL